MPEAKLGRLTNVLPRSVWPHEAQDFTPWLLDNVDVLSELLGMDELVLEAAEHPVGGFSLDIIGRNLADDGVVIVENQLDKSDHTHLGQILTYAAGTDPKTIVWITCGFRPEHRAALTWLNDQTDPGTRFFGIEINVVKIGESLPAPDFRIVVEPNDWEKHVKVAAAAAGMTEKSQRYWAFWDEFRTKLVANHPTWTNSKTSTPYNYFEIAAGTSGVVYSHAFGHDGLRLALDLVSEDAAVNAERFAYLSSKKELFEETLGGKAVWAEKPGKKSSAIYLLSSFSDVADTDNWPHMIDWLIDAQKRFRAAIAAVGGLAH